MIHEFSVFEFTLISVLTIIFKTLFFRDSFYVYNKIERKVQRFLRHFLFPFNMQSLPHYPHYSLEWYIFNQGWNYNDTP